MKKDNLVLAIDIGSTGVRAAVALSAPGVRPEVLGIGIGRPSGVTRGVVTDVQLTADAVSQASAQACGVAGQKLRRAVVNVGGESTIAFHCVGAAQISNASGTVAHEDVRRATRTAVQRVLPKECQELHPLPRAFHVDKRWTDTPIGMHGGYLETDVHLIAGHTNAMRTLRRSLRLAGLRPSGFVFDALAAGATALGEDVRQSGAALVDIGGDHSSLVVYCRNRVIHTSVFPIGGSHITGDIAHCFGMPFEAAEVIKQGHAQASMEGIGNQEAITAPTFENRKPIQIKRRKLAWVVGERTKEWMRHLRGALAEANVLGRLPGGITLVGGGALLSGLAEEVTKSLGMECVVGYPNGVTGHLDILRSPAMATVVGLVQYAAAPPERSVARNENWFVRRVGRAWAWAREAL